MSVESLKANVKPFDGNEKLMTRPIVTCVPSGFRSQRQPLLRFVKRILCAYHLCQSKPIRSGMWVTDKSLPTIYKVLRSISSTKGGKKSRLMRAV